MEEKIIIDLQEKTKNLLCEKIKHTHEKETKNIYLYLLGCLGFETLYSREYDICLFLINNMVSDYFIKICCSLLLSEKNVYSCL